MKILHTYTSSLGLAGLLIACGGGGGEGTIDVPEPATPQAERGAPLELTVAPACVLDADCRSGSVCFQGACATGSAAMMEVVPDLSIVDEGPRVRRVMPGETMMSITLALSDDVPAGGLPYRVERTDQPEAEAAIEVAAGDGQTVTFDLPTGLANPDADGSGDPVYVNVVSAAGTVRVVLTPRLPAEGTYQGEAVLGTFGQLGLPMELSVVTDPPGADLASATAAYLVLPIEEGNLFNPLPPTEEGPTFVARPLEYDEFVRAWVARFEMPYTLDAASAFGWVSATESNAVTRSMRFELSPNGEGVLIGNVSDRWSGLFEARSEAGILEPEDIVFEGTVEFDRIAAAPSLEEITPIVDYETDPAGILPLPTLDQCAAVTFDASIDLDGRTLDCVGVDDVAGFEAALPDAQAACALAMAQTALEAGTTASQIQAFLDDQTPNPGGLSFAEFMQRCTAQTDGTCVPTPELLCSRQLVARAVKVAPEDSTDLLELVRRYQDTTREAFLGRQFGAYFADAQTRLDWLQAQDYPAIVTSAVQSFVAGLLEDWQNNVLEAHVSVIRGQFDSAGGAVLGQNLQSAPTALSAQRQLLLETSQSWRSAAEAFALGATRWGSLLTDPVDRLDKATYVYDRTLDLYVVAGLLAEQNRRAGAGANNAVFGGGFRPLLASTRQLALPFDRLIYERQGEVVVSTSLDPTRGNEVILAELRTEALAEVADADEAVTEVLAQAQAELLQQAELTNRIANEAAALETEIAELCGLPAGCDQPDEGTCAPRIKAGECGFVTGSDGVVQDAFPSETNPSEAGAAILKVRAALLELRRAEEAVRGHAAQTELYHRTTQAFAQQVTSWNSQRRQLIGAVEGQISMLQGSADAALTTLAANAASQLSVREQRIADQQAFVDGWSTVRYDGIEDDFDEMVTISRIRSVASGLDAAATAIDDKAKAVVEGLPKTTGMSNDVTAPARMAVLMSKYYVTKIMKAGALAANAAANKLESSLAKTQAKREAQLTELQLQDGVGASQAEADVEALRNQALLVTTATELEQGIVREVIQNMERDVNAALAFERDLVELRDRRDEVLARLIENDELHIAVQQAELTVEQALSEYARIVQRAQLLSGRLATVRTQLNNVNQILGSPAAVFAWANRLTRAENRLERAKESLMDWVVALEYFAVRPFFDPRIQILLARNTTQLEEIAQDLERIQNQCGGALNEQVVEVSVRDDLLGISRAQVDLQSGDAVEPEARFRTLMQEARISIDKRVRYKSDATVGDLLNRSDVYAVTFDIGMNEFANLANACNAKVRSLSVQLVGADLGDALPTVSVLYDGTSRLRSCQPDIDAIVELVGADVTPFSEITEFKTPGRSVSPVAGINEFPGTSNQSLGGLPLASQYTVLIDPEAGENGRLDWTKLQDVQLRIEYTYQDLFPAGQCQ